MISYRGRASVMTLALAFAAASCSRSPEPSPGPDTGARSREEPLPAVPRMPAPPRIVAIGDVHGDLAATRAALRLAGASDDKDAWVGGGMMVVQVGDEVDRGDDDRAIVDLFDRLAEQAKAAGGSVVAMLGNHEVMNVEQRFDYVTEGGFRGFEGIAGANPRDARVSSLPEPARARAAALLPGAPYARVLAKRPVVMVVGDTVFVHGGLEAKHVRYGLERLNRETSAWMNGERAAPPKPLDAEDGPTWLRRYSAAPDAGDCKVLETVLELIGARRMVMGHTVQRGGISSACGERAWRIDVGLASYYGGRPEVLLIEGSKVTAVRAP